VGPKTMGRHSGDQMAGYFTDDLNHPENSSINIVDFEFRI
jgi:hypothetical protein